MKDKQARRGVQDGHRARKRFGQNFLVDHGVIDSIVSAIAPQGDDTVIEIGPGLGALTCALAPNLKHLTVVELDRDVVPKLRAKCLASGYGPDFLTILEQDALTLSLADVQAEGSVRLAGNLPYNIATPLIFHLLSQRERIADMTFMMQKEVVERLCAEPGNRDYGRLTVMVQAYASAEYLFTVSPEAFNPPPKVDSAIVRLSPLAEPLVTPEEADGFAELVTLAFAQRRKTLNNNLKQRVSASTIKEAGLDPAQRAETISVPEFVNLARHVFQN